MFNNLLKPFNKGANSGFTLPEIMTAVAIMGSLAYFGISTTFEIVGDLKTETKTAVIAQDLKMQLSQELKNPNFANMQTAITDCQQNDAYKNNKTARIACYKDKGVLWSANGKTKIAGSQDRPLFLTKDGQVNQPGKDVPCEASVALCKIKIVASIDEFCDFKKTAVDDPRTPTDERLNCGPSEEAAYTQIRIVYSYGNHGPDAPEDQKPEALFAMTTVISNQSNTVTHTSDSTCEGSYSTGFSPGVNANCSTAAIEDINKALSGFAIEGATGVAGKDNHVRGPRGDVGPRGPRGSMGRGVYCHSKGGGVALTSSQKAALNRLQGPARILSGSGSSVYVRNRAGHHYTMSKSSIVSWASRGGGCFAEGTTIIMADGSKKPIELIKKGDLVWNPLTNKPAKVLKGVKGPEEFKMYSFKVNGKEVNVTKTHPMLTQRGILKAEAVQKDDLMMWKSGELVAIDSIRTYYTDKDVYNLHLVSEDGKNIEGAVVANDVITGDLEMQQELQKKDKKTAQAH